MFLTPGVYFGAGVYLYHTTFSPLTLPYSSPSKTGEFSRIILLQFSHYEQKNVHLLQVTTMHSDLVFTASSSSLAVSCIHV